MFECQIVLNDGVRKQVRNDSSHLVIIFANEIIHINMRAYNRNIYSRSSRNGSHAFSFF